jgi:GGDEF domain-containing protein
MAKIHPVELTVKTGIIGFVVLLTALLGIAVKWEAFYNFFLPDGKALNWRFVLLLAFVAALLVWFVMNDLWRREFAAHQKTKFECDNLRGLLSTSEKQRMTDVITGVPNRGQLENDLEDFFRDRESREQAQLILIDINNFREINRRFGFLKGDELLRMVAQDIYSSMRRNEDMYKHSGVQGGDRALWKTFYRRYPGGDEFLFLIEGDQSDAIGFVVNRLYSTFKTALTNKAAEILKTDFPLSFHCAVAPVTKRDKARDVLERIEDCYMRAAEGKSPFTICWYPTDFEHRVPDGSFKKALYEKARKNFEVMNLDQPHDPERRS